MDPNTASQFVSSLVQCIQAFCHGYVQFSSSIEIVGHIYLNVDKNSKFNYILNEEVNKNQSNLTTEFNTNSYHSLPPTKQMLLRTSHHGNSNIDTVSGRSPVQNSILSADSISSTLPNTNKTISVAYPVNIVQNDRDFIVRTAVLSHPSPFQDSIHKPSPELLSSKHFWKRKKCSKHLQPKHIYSLLDPAILIKQEPEISFPHNSCSVKNMSNGKKHILDDESGEPCGVKVNSKSSSEPYHVAAIAKLENTDLENCASNVADLTPGRESVVSETAGTHPTKGLPSQIRHQIVEYANIVGNRPAARHFGVHESSIRHWRKKFGMVLQGVGGKRGRKRKDDSCQDMRNIVVDASTLKVDETELP